MVQDHPAAGQAHEFQGLRRFVRLSSRMLGSLLLLWVLVLPLALKYGGSLVGVPVLGPESMRLAMPDQEYWDWISGRRDGLPQPAGRQQALQVMGRGLVKLADDGAVEWELPLEGQTQLARQVGTERIRALSFGANPGECTITAVSPAGELLWQRPAGLSPDCLAAVDDTGRLVLTGNGRQLAVLDEAGQLLERRSTEADLRYAELLEDGRRLVNFQTKLGCWGPMLQCEWEFESPGGFLTSMAFDNGRIVVMDDSGALYCLDYEGRLQWQRPEGVTREADGSHSYGNMLSFSLQADGPYTLLFFHSNRGDWAVLDPQGELLWQGSGLNYMPYQTGSAAQLVFHDGPDGRRCFKRGPDSIQCVDSDWQGIWEVECGDSAEIINATKELLLVHESGRSLAAWDWDGELLWRQQFEADDGYVRTVLNAGGLSTYRTHLGLLVGIGNDGTQRFRLQLSDNEEYDLAADGSAVYVTGTNMADNSQNWMMAELRDALNQSFRYHVDCYDAQGRRIWQARLPERMVVEKLRRLDGGALAVVAQPLVTGYTMGMQDYSDWEFIFHPPE